MIRILLAVICFMCGATSASAAPAANLADAPNVKDHPAVSRFSGATLLAANEVPYGSVTLQLGPLAMTDAGKRAVAPRTLQAAGRVFRYVYVAPASTSTAEVHANYQDALQRDGFKVEYACAGRTCGAAAHGRIYGKDTGLDKEIVRWIPFTATNATFIAARSVVADRPLWILVMIDTFGKPNDPAQGRPAILQVIIEEKAAALGNVQTDADAIAQALASTGRIALYGVLFDVDSATVKAESRAQLEQIAAFMRANPSVKVLVVGHTDNQGTVPYNVDLSRRRAVATVTALTTEFAVDAKRLEAHGVGMLAPTASNRTEAGRAKNRRVEIVER
jgi:outer membrane protein OmpA-like peptidoglycan-associated protein